MKNSHPITIQVESKQYKYLMEIAYQYTEGNKTNVFKFFIEFAENNNEKFQEFIQEKTKENIDKNKYVFFEAYKDGTMKKQLHISEIKTYTTKNEIENMMKNPLTKIYKFKGEYCYWAELKR